MNYPVPSAISILGHEPPKNSLVHYAIAIDKRLKLSEHYTLQSKIQKPGSYAESRDAQLGRHHAEVATSFNEQYNDALRERTQLLQ